MVEHEYTKNITCPYCGYEDKNSWEYREESGDIECPDCGKKFHYNRNVDVTYCTSADCKDNDENHEWSEWDYIESNEDVITKELHEEVNDFYIRKCFKCDEQEFIRFKNLERDI
jgi:DNA-directed RNA polymerase subunit RPC12/RpoP